MNNNVKCAEFAISDLFSISRGDIKNQKSIIELDSAQDGSVSFIAQNNSDNGYVSIVDPEECKVFPGNSIAVGRQTGVVYYQKDDFVTTDGVLVLEPTFDINVQVGLFITSAMTKLLQSFGYDNTVSATKLNNMTIELPISPTGQPDFDFMENYIKEIEQKHITKVKSDLDSRTRNLLTMIGREDLIDDPDGLASVVAAGFDDSGIDYAQFRVGDLFDVQRGRRLKSADREPGDAVYCSATQSNNGVTDHIDNPLFIAKNKITVSTFLDVFYQEGEFTASDEITMLGADWLDRSSGLFIATTIKKSQHGYGYSHKAFSKEVSNFIIDLPVTVTGQPDFDFMAQYIAYIELKYTHTDAMNERERIDLMVELTQRKTP